MQNNFSPNLVKDYKFASTTSRFAALQNRWEKIRIFEIQRQLREFSGINFQFSFDKKLTKPNNNTILLEKTILKLPTNILAGVMAHLWAHLMFKHYPKHPFLKKIISHANEKKTIKFTAQFLAFYNYAIENTFSEFNLYCPFTIKNNEKINYKNEEKTYIHFYNYYVKFFQKLEFLPTTKSNDIKSAANDIILQALEN